MVEDHILNFDPNLFCPRANSWTVQQLAISKHPDASRLGVYFSIVIFSTPVNLSIQELSRHLPLFTSS